MSARTSVRLALAALLLAAGPADALLFRAYLSSHGSDANPCTVDLPCRLLPAALAAVADGGEIWMLDSANYNLDAIVIDKSVSILAVTGAVGSIVTAVAGNPAIYIGTDNLKVALRNVVIGPLAGFPAGTYGVQMTGASALSIEHSLIANLTYSGVFVQGNGTVKIAHTTLRNIAQPSIMLVNGARAMISSSQMLNNGGGVALLSGVPSKSTFATVVDSVVSGTGTDSAIQASTGGAGSSTRISLTRCTIEHSGGALSSVTTGAGTAEINIGSSLVVDNIVGWYISGAGATILTLGNNQMSGNGSSTGSLTTLPGQ
jgi:hypothetical protein